MPSNPEAVLTVHASVGCITASTVRNTRKRGSPVCGFRVGHW